MAATDKPTVETTYPLMHHLTELRKRLMYIAGFIFVVFILCYWQSDIIFHFVRKPIEPFLGDTTSLSMLTLTEGFLTELKISFLASVFLSMPFILYQFWKFVAPGLYKQERKYLTGFVFFASLLFLAGAAFAYYIVFPLGMSFLTSYSKGVWGITATLSVAWYLSFVIKMLLAFGSVFELPVIIFFLTLVGIVNTEMLIKYRKFAIVGIFILAAILTPPDVISQVAMAIPLLLLYEISIIITRIFGRKKEETTDKPVADIYE